MLAELPEGQRGEAVEVVALAEEGGEIGGQCVDELLPFLGMPFEVGEIPGEAVQPEAAQAPRQAAVDQLVLVLREIDAGALVEPLAHLLEVAAGVEEFVAGEGKLWLHGSFP
ncbi:hypothetical protein D3C76_678100 [compost metagenome]